MITASHLRSALIYDPETGIFTWKYREDTSVQWNGRYAGTTAGCICKPHKYLNIKIDGRRYPASRLAWLYMTGKWPENMVDHHDLDRGNNRWINLRDATRSQNGMNAPRRSDNTSGFKNVHWHKKHQCWTAQIFSGGKLVWLGSFKTKDAAYAAYCVAAAKIHKDFARVA